MTEFKYAYIGIGTNLGNKLNNIQSAIKWIQESIGAITGESKLYKTPPWGFNANEDFLNCVVKIETSLHPIELLDKLKTIEEKMGRDLGPKDGYQSRIIDLDIIDYNGQMFYNERLSVPHPLMNDRNFVLFPLRDLELNWKHPITGVNINLLIESLVTSNIEIVRNDL